MQRGTERHDDVGLKKRSCTLTIFVFGTTYKDLNQISRGNWQLVQQRIQSALLFPLEDVNRYTGSQENKNEDSTQITQLKRTMT